MTFRRFFVTKFELIPMKKLAVIGLFLGFSLLDCHSQVISFDTSFGEFGAKSYNTSEFPYRFPSLRLGKENQLVLMTNIKFAIYDQHGEWMDLNPNQNPDSLNAGKQNSILDFEINQHNQAKILFSNTYRGGDLCYLKTLDLNNANEPDFNKKEVIFLDSVQRLLNFRLGLFDSTIILALSKLDKFDGNELVFYRIHSIHNILRKKVSIPNDFSCSDSILLFNFLSNVVIDPFQNSYLILRQSCDSTHSRDLILKVDHDLDAVREFGDNGFLVLPPDINRYIFVHLFYHDGLILQYWDQEFNEMIFIRYDPDGDSDLNFGVNGMIRFKLSGDGNENLSKAILIEEDEAFLFFDRDKVSDSSYLVAVNFKGEKVNNLVTYGNIAISGVVAQFESRDKRNFYLLGRPSIPFSNENKMYKLVKNGRLASHITDSKNMDFELERIGNEIIIRGDGSGDWNIEVIDLIGRKLKGHISRLGNSLSIKLQENLIPGAVYFIRITDNKRFVRTIKICHFE